MMSNSSIDMALNPSLSCAKEHLNKYFHRHAGALENCFCVSSISALHGGQYQHPVDNCFYWILVASDSLSSAWASCVALSPASMQSSRDISHFLWVVFTSMTMKILPQRSPT